MSSIRQTPESAAELRLRRFAEALGVPLMGEASAKLVPGALLTDRFLLSAPIAALAPGAVADIVEMAETLGLDSEAAAILSFDLETADVLHFGYEGSRAEGAILKLYCEFAAVVGDWNRARREGRRLLVHRAVKWDPDSAEGAAVSLYEADPTLSVTDTVDRIFDLLGDHPAADLVVSVFHRAAGRLPAQDRLFLEVTEQGTDRRSFDLKVYDAGFTVGSFGDAMSELATAFGFDRVDRDRLSRLPSAEVLGHLSGGRGRDGRPFLTLYYGGGPR
ncbi:hypothetical protein [Devosia sp.]|uniref:hypothetical protein n=1 Tax=Devosia sp. TaxID=1871048 RepID=UPI0035B4E5D6